MLLNLSLPFDLKKAEVYFDKLKQKGAKIEIKSVEGRSVRQNSYLHVCIGLIANETGYDIEEAKVILKREFGSFMVYEKKGEKFLTSTSKLTTLECTQFVDWIRTFSMEQLGCYIPTPDEYYQNKFEIDKSISHLYR